MYKIYIPLLSNVCEFCWFCILVIAVSIFFRASFSQEDRTFGYIENFQLELQIHIHEIWIVNDLFTQYFSMQLESDFFFYLICVDLKVLWSFCVIWQFGLCLIKCSDAHYKKLCQILFSFFLFRNAHKIAGFVSWRWYLFEGNFLIYR